MLQNTNTKNVFSMKTVPGEPLLPVLLYLVLREPCPPAHTHLHNCTYDSIDAYFKVVFDITKDNFNVTSLKTYKHNSRLKKQNKEELG
jgi:hypothetical protein